MPPPYETDESMEFLNMALNCAELMFADVEDAVRAALAFERGYVSDECITQNVLREVLVRLAMKKIFPSRAIKSRLSAKPIFPPAHETGNDVIAGSPETDMPDVTKIGMRSTVQAASFFICPLTPESRASVLLLTLKSGRT